MSDEIITTSWFNRLGQSVKGILFGFLLFIASFFLLSWNENRAVNQYRNLNEVQETTISIQPEVVRPELNQKTVHLTGKAETSAKLKDPAFGVKVNAIRLTRTVETYVWREHEERETTKKTGGSTETHIRYSYEKTWSDQIPTGRFKGPNAGQYSNPTRQAYEDWSKSADTVTLGAFRLSTPLVAAITFTEPLQAKQAALPEGAVLHDGYVFIGKNPVAPEIGDTRIRFRQTPQDTISVIAGQNGSDLEEARLSNGKRFHRVSRGEHSLEDMVATAKSEVKILTWILRAVGFLLMGVGLSMMFRPLVIVADVVPFFGSLIGAGVGFISFSIAAVLSCLTIAIAWIAVRPVVGIPLLLAAAALCVWIWKRKRAAQPSPDNPEADGYSASQESE